MQEPFENEEEHIEDQRTENELKKIKLALEHGMDLSNSFTDPGMPPEVEGEFLDYIQQWEDQYAKRKTAVIYDFVGRPQWRPVAEIPHDEIVSELERIIEVLTKNGVVLDALSEVDDREFYRFITEELFNKETNDIRIPGMMHCFTYEDFYPNHEYDIKNRCDEVVNHIIDNRRNSDLTPWGLADMVWYGANELTKEELNKKLINFRDSFSSFTLHEFEYTVINVNETKNGAEAFANIRYSGIIDGSNDSLEFKGVCSFTLECEYDWWIINRFEIPGVLL